MKNFYFYFFITSSKLDRIEDISKQEKIKYGVIKIKKSELKRWYERPDLLKELGSRLIKKIFEGFKILEKNEKIRT